ncbi:TetR family transcriptional regulator [Streptomyces albus subsp. chlorinus]|uniref:TetR/AcrR family transcriptional regulator n=1 Tax=Streptomyces albus TaxID=1888 RepID=UPI00156FD547|nr:TetR/AcrR family transcriptional regulator C-terminal domain-containing protein [Streptomyces albus]NSC22168.1 TetR family transcriptional regulator [Streptomyces albus subsp. chlorinus]
MPRPPRISRSAVLDEALRTLDEEGIEGLTMRRLAQRLGVTSPSLYKYVRDREGVFEAVVDVIVQEINEGAEQTTGGWRAHLNGMARRYFDTFRRHPNAVPLVMHRPTRDPRSLDGFDTIFAVLLSEGWPAQDATRAILLVESYALGATLTAVSPGIPSTEELESRPSLAAALIGERRAFRLTEDDFDHGLKIVLDGIARETAPSSRRLETVRGGAEPR